MRFLLSSLCLVISLCLLTGWPRSFQALNNVNLFGNQSAHRKVTILLWHWPFGKPLNLRGDVCWDLYNIPYCTLVDRRSYFPSADVVAFHHRELMDGHQKLPVDLPRPQGQRWAWMTLESPKNSRKLRQFKNIFNLTMSYRRDADVSIPYGERLPQEEEGQLVENDSLNKSSLVCWVVSNYRSQHKRSKVYKELRATVPVTVYGHWTKTPLSSTALLPAISRCYFYLAFENSVSKDYITEKLWRNAYQGNAVPVVLGPSLSDYKAVAPPNSFIHIDEFSSVKEMGEYLQRLAGDKKHYNEYLSWKLKWQVKCNTDWRERLCKICTQYKYLPQHKVYSDLEAWVNANNS